jgi:ABC-type multidrug transport system fused ATPase/permease subunit
MDNNKSTVPVSWNIHILPEMTANLLGPVCIIIYLFVIDWPMALISLITVPIGLFCYMGMMKDYEVTFKHYVDSNKYLNATAVEYINGIEAIKTFNQSVASYRKFTDAAREAAGSAINWMRGTLSYFSAAMSVFPAVLIGVLPLGSYFYMKGSLNAETFILIIILSLGIMTPLITVMSYTEITTVVKDIPLEQLNTMIAYVSQDNYLFNDTVGNNIRMGNRGATDKEVDLIITIWAILLQLLPIPVRIFRI